MVRRAIWTPWSPHLRSIWVWTGRRSISWCRSAHPRGPRACYSGSGGPITRSTIRAGPCWSRPTGLKCWSAGRRWTPSAPTRWMAFPNGPAGSTCWPSTSSVRPVLRVPVDRDGLFDQVRTAGPYAGLSREDFDDVFTFVATGGYALGAYDRFKRLHRNDDGLYEISSKTAIRDYRMNVGTIVEAPTLKVRMGRGKVLGEVEENFVNYMTAGDTFVFAGRLLEFIEVRETSVITRPGKGDAPAVPAYGGRLPLTRPIWPTGCGPFCQTQNVGRTCPNRFRNGWRCSAGGPPCPRAMACWSKPFRAAGNTIWWPIASKAGTPTRPSGCYSPGAWRAWVSARWVCGHRLRARRVEVQIRRDRRYRGAVLQKTCWATTWREWMAESSMLKRTFRATWR